MKDRDIRRFWDEEGRRIGLTPVVLIIAKGGEDVNPAHDFVLPKEFGRTLNYAIAVCRRCGAEYDVFYSAKGVQWRPRNEAAKTPYCRQKADCGHLRGGVCEIFGSGCRPQGCPHYTTEEGR